MPDEDVTIDDIKATAQAKAEGIKEDVKENLNEAKARLSELTINQKLVLTAVAAVVASLVIQKFGKKLRPVRIDADTIVMVEPDPTAVIR